jgi:DNA invertase Pin-like site-specific DNA recombinase
MGRMKNKDKKENIKKVAIYVRVSTEDQAKEGFSLSAQLERLRSYCSARGWRIYREYVDDGYSGRYTNRPAYQKMLEEMEKWDVLLVLKMDRIHRNSRNFMEMMELLNKNNKEFVSMTESLDTSTAMGRFVMDIIQRIAQLESEQIGERVYTGMEQKARTPAEQLGGGRHPYLGFAHPYGYNYSKGRLTVNEEEAKYVRFIFQEYVGGKTLDHICRRLNEMGVPTKKGKKWAKYTISKILKNPLYAGYLEWNGIIKKNKHEAIIDKETYNKAQKIIEERGGVPVYIP